VDAISAYIIEFFCIIAVCSSEFVILINGDEDEPVKSDSFKIFDKGTDLDLGCFSANPADSKMKFWWKNRRAVSSDAISSDNYGKGALIHYTVVKDADFTCGTSLQDFPIVLHIQGTSIIITSEG